MYVCVYLCFSVELVDTRNLAVGCCWFQLWLLPTHTPFCAQHRTSTLTHSITFMCLCTYVYVSDRSRSAKKLSAPAQIQCDVHSPKRGCPLAASNTLSSNPRHASHQTARCQAPVAPVYCPKGHLILLSFLLRIPFPHLQHPAAGFITKYLWFLQVRWVQRVYFRIELYVCVAYSHLANCGATVALV